ncbi:hypothetical protein CVD28_03125 [Bacillus sp. M6-12]|uniref:hypothetical protein n=1 Tax=Bacillus sp. M6-12 TaxID=2054166 RepID=UPI000C78FC7A|nr:hypothetical protein [Bacillus sp. M6-12]PLS19422.1 hypothetical protein CVD28_03125 [Bacillus sp. M6-12]
MKRVEVVVESYNVDALETGLGVKLSALSQEQLSKILSHALGYVDYTDERIANELKEVAGIKSEQTFYSLYKSGGIHLEKIDDYIEEWHNGDSDKELHEFLGLTWEQYSIYVKDGVL